MARLPPAAASGEALRIEGDPLVPSHMGNRTAEQIAAVHAVASAIRHLGEREAAFSRADIYRTALGFALPTSMPEIERRVDQLLRQGPLLKGKGADRVAPNQAGKGNPPGERAADPTVGDRNAVAGNGNYQGLPPRDRAALQQSQKDKYPEEYAPLIEQYLRSLSEEGGKQ